MLTTTASYRLIAHDLAGSLNSISKRPEVARETEYYLSRIGTIKSIDDFLADSRVFRYAMHAFGMDDMTYAKAFMRKVLAEGTDGSTSLANRFADRRYREFVETFNFARYGAATTAFDRTQQGTVDRYVRQTLEETAGAQNDGVRLALYFERKAPEISSTYAILADPALLKFVLTTFGLPAEFSLGAIDRQAEMLAKRLNTADLKDPQKLSKLVSRFTAMWELQRPAAPSVATGLLPGQAPAMGLGTDLLHAIQRLGRGR